MESRQSPWANTIVMLAGYARSGKDTAGAYLVERYGLKRYAFADKLKAAARKLSVAIPLEQLNDTQQFRLTGALQAAGMAFEYQRGDQTLHLSYWDGRDETKRHPCVQLGKVLRDEVDPMIWVNALYGDERFWQDVDKSGVVITDVRYENERSAVMEAAARRPVPLSSARQVYQLLLWLERNVEPQGEEVEKTLPLKQRARVITNDDTIANLGNQLDLAMGEVRAFIDSLHAGL